MNPIVSFVSIFLEISPVEKSSDLTSLIFSLESYIVFTMEDLDFRLFIAGVEVSLLAGSTETGSKYLLSTNF